MDEAQKAWLAGIIEGEGYIGFTGKNSVVLHVGMTDRDIIDRVEKITGIGKRYIDDKQRGKPLFVWKVHNKEELVPILLAIRPWMGERRSDRIDHALKRLEQVRNQGECTRGHVMSGDNLYVSPGGQRMCRACVKVRETSRRIKRHPSGRRGRHPRDCDCQLHAQIH